MSYHLIFEGAELAGKSWLMSQVYNYLEDKFGQSHHLLDGCHWFNADVGLYGTKHGKVIIQNYINIFEEIRDRNIIVEKLHISDIVYNEFYRQISVDYEKEEEILKKLNFKIIFIKFKPNISLLEKRIQDRLNLYPHYQKILKSPDWYIEQQQKYEEKIKKSQLDYFPVETNVLPDDKIVSKIISWI